MKFDSIFFWHFIWDDDNVQNHYKNNEKFELPPHLQWSNSILVLLFVLQRKELGVLVYDCSCLALDLHRVFSLYWGLKLRDFVPSYWSKRLFALFNRDAPLELTINNTKAQAYISVSGTLWHLKALLFSSKKTLIFYLTDVFKRY